MSFGFVAGLETDDGLVTYFCPRETGADDLASELKTDLEIADAIGSALELAKLHRIAV